MALTKNNLIDMINDTFGIPKKECYTLIESCFEIIRDELSKGNDILISGFGKWSVKEKKERKGRNPQTGEQITIRARKVISFQSARKLRDKING